MPAADADAQSLHRVYCLTSNLAVCRVGPELSTKYKVDEVG